jgi:hypothetical protein
MSLPVVVSVSNSKLASSLLALGFAFTAELVQSDKPGAALHTQFLFRGKSQRPEYQHISLTCVGLWESGTLDKTEPMHPLCIMMRADENYDRLQDWQQKGIQHSLRAVADNQMLIYRRGPLRDFQVEHFPLTDFALAACLGGVGIPVTKIEGEPGSRVYTLPRFGYARARPDGSLMLEDGLELIRRAPTATDPLRLRLEDTDPTHPVVRMYDKLNCRALLREKLLTTTPLLLIQEEGTTRQALITMNSAGRVMKRVDNHFKSPPIKW